MRLDAKPACIIAVHQDSDVILFDVGHARQLDDLRLVELNHCWRGPLNFLLFDLFLRGKSGERDQRQAECRSTTGQNQISFIHCRPILLNP